MNQQSHLKISIPQNDKFLLDTARYLIIKILNGEITASEAKSIYSQFS